MFSHTLALVGPAFRLTIDGEAVVAVTARAAVACYLLRVLLDICRRRAAAPSLATCLVWTVGGAIYLGHVVAAYHFVHGWSQSAALQHTAFRTAQVTGMHWSGGLYINYAFTALWLGDVAVQWNSYFRGWRPPRWYTWPVQFTLAFIMFNATAIFGPRFWWGVTAAVLVVFGAAAVLTRNRATQQGDS